MTKPGYHGPRRPSKPKPDEEEKPMAWGPGCRRPPRKPKPKPKG